MVIVESILAFILLVGILVFIHELGHFLAARWCGVRADVFAVGMGPRVMGWNKHTGFSFGKLPEGLDLGDDTDYRIAAFPIGGYVKIHGMVDESMDTNYASGPPQPWEFRSKSTPQKALIISAGVIMNVLLAIVIFAGLNLFHGKELKSTTTIGPMLSGDSVAHKAGLREGDRIVSINGTPVKYFEDIAEQIYFEQEDKDLTIVADRSGTPVTAQIARTTIPPIPSIFPYPNQSHVGIGEVFEGTPAEKAGIKRGDMVVSANGVPTVGVSQFMDTIKANGGRVISLVIDRDGQTISINVTPGSDNKIGAQLEPIYKGPTEKKQYGFLEAIGSGFKETADVTLSTFGLVGKLFTGKAKLKDSVGGPVVIASIAQKTMAHGVPEFLRLMAILSVTLACMNILPIPALDGGHLVFIIIEGIIRREVPLKVRMAVQQVGFALLIILMIFILYNDVSRTF